MNRPHATIGLVAALLAFPAGTAAAAQLYKWVDESGVVNYSNLPPADPRSARNVRGVEDRVSVYTPDPALERAITAFRQRVNEAFYEAPVPTQPAVAMLGTPYPLPTAYESYVSDYPYWIVGGYRPRPRPLPGSHPNKPAHVPGLGSPYVAQQPAFHRPLSSPRDSRFR